jgi:hypothetical protein
MQKCCSCVALVKFIKNRLWAASHMALIIL